ncbi:MAG: hypothetical protein ACKV2T_31280 [Kofleriaceae bacterium]
MQPIEALPSQDLENVRGGFIGALLGAAPGILQGVSGIIQASRAGKGGGGGPPPGGGGSPGGPAPGAETAAAARGAAAGGLPGGAPPSDSGVSISISINGVAQQPR